VLPTLSYGTLWRDAKRHVAQEYANRRRHLNCPRGCAGRYRRGQISFGNNFKTRRDTVERNRGGSGETLAENLDCFPSFPCGLSNKRDERRRSDVHAVENAAGANRAIHAAASAAACRAAKETAVGMLKDGRIRSFSVGAVKTVNHGINAFWSDLKNGTAAARWTTRVCSTGSVPP